jgi:hypothetical protein
MAVIYSRAVPYFETHRLAVEPRPSTQIPVQDQPVARRRGARKGARSLASGRRFLYPKVDLAGGSRL